MSYATIWDGGYTTITIMYYVMRLRSVVMVIFKLIKGTKLWLEGVKIMPKYFISYDRKFNIVYSVWKKKLQTSKKPFMMETRQDV